MDPNSSFALSALDSERFDLRVFRGTFSEIDERQLFREIVENVVDVAIVRVPAGSAPQLSRLARFGMPPIHADTLVYYTLDFPRFTPTPLRNSDLSFSEATAEDSAELSSLIPCIFEGYVSHYHANPVLPRELTLQGYAQWALGYVGGTSNGRITWIARRNGKLVAFACCAFDTETKTSEGVLYGVHPDHSGGGVYGDLIRYSQLQFHERGYDTMSVSTQVWNFAVQKVWTREGFTLKNAYDTFHINPLLSCGDELVRETLNFSESQVAGFAAASGDYNPVHLDEDAAKRAGFESRITHGMLAGAELSRIFGTAVPGIGTLFLRSDLIFLRPIYCGRDYCLSIRYSSEAPLQGYIRAVATIRNQASELCLLSYNDLLKRG